MDHVVVDVEIQKEVNSLPRRWDDTHLMGVGCAVVYEFGADRFRIYGPGDENALQDRLLAADRISGYNILQFDFPVIWQLPRGTALPPALEAKTDDLMLRIFDALRLPEDGPHRGKKGFTLDAVVKATLPGRPGKIAHGSQAPAMFQEGRFAELHTYCLDDVALERDLCRWIEDNGYVNSPNEPRRIMLCRWPIYLADRAARLAPQGPAEALGLDLEG